MRAERRDLHLNLKSFSLDNGLEVYLHQDDSLPLVAVDVWYHVGSKDESPSRTGLAHLFEHLMFEGSLHHDDDYFKPLQEAGGTVNGSTSNDRTNYYEVVPSNFLERALWMEADRMAHLLPVLDQAKLDNQRSVVMNERRQRVDNQPYGRIGESISKELYPSNHPYSWPVLGWMEHLEATTIEDVHGFFRSHYRPNNAVLVIAGRFESESTRRWIDRYFGGIALPSTAASLPREYSQPDLTREHRVEWEERVGLPRLDLVWPTVTRYHDDEPALDVAAQILAGRSRDSRLKRRLVIREKLVQSIGAYHHCQMLSGQFGVRAFALPHVATESIRDIVDEEIEQLKRHPPSREEIQSIRLEFENHAYSRMETILGKADYLNHHRFHHGTVSSDSFSQEIIRYNDVTGDEVSAALRKYLRSGRVVVEVKPESKSGSTVTSADEWTAKATGEKRRGRVSDAIPGAGPTPPFRLPMVERTTLSDGLKVVVVRKPELPRVDFQLLLDAGSFQESSEQAGLARLVGDVLDEGTTARDGLELARRLDLLGATLSVSTGIESAAVSLRALTAYRDEAFKLFAEVVCSPRFAPTDLERERQRILAEIEYRMRQPAYLADEAIDQAIFGPEHAYGRPSDGTAEGLERITVDDLAAFHDRHYRSHATLLAVGDITRDEACKLAERHLFGWFRNTREVSAPTMPMGGTANGPVSVVSRPGAAQSVLRVGKRSVERTSPDYYSLLVLNTVLGGQFASRLNLNLREAKGLTYGARSGFHLRRLAGAFIAGTDVQSSATRDAVAEMLREIDDLGNARPVTPEELKFAKAYLIRRFPARFETVGAIVSHLAQLAIYGLPDDYYDHYIDRVAAVEAAQLLHAAQKHLAREGMKVAVVGDPKFADGLASLLA
ncbi:MAG: pitrilysin family protein [Planctomycetota bacterium]